MRDFGWQNRSGFPIWLMPATEDGLWYQVELWNRSRSEVERVLARAVDAAIARRMFEAACREHPDRYIRLSRGAQVVEETD